MQLLAEGNPRVVAHAPPGGPTDQSKGRPSFISEIGFLRLDLG